MRPARHPAGGYSAVLFGHPVLRVPFSEYYECVRLPLRLQPSSFDIYESPPVQLLPLFLVGVSKTTKTKGVSHEQKYYS